MRRLLVCLALGLAVPRSARAVIPPKQVAEVVSAAGATATSAGFTLSFVVAQPTVGTSNDAKSTLIAGFFFAGAVVLAVGDELRPPVSRLVSIGPNPGAGPTAIAFEIGAGDDRSARLDVIDVQGRRVRTLALGPLAPGHHTIEWRGDDDAGRMLPVGVYEARLETASANSTLRTVRLR